MTHAPQAPSSPVSFDVHVARLPQNGTPVVIDADERQREELAKAHGLLSVESFHADLVAKAWKRHGVQVTGNVRADITQACVVTLEPVVAHIDEPVEGLFLPDDSKLGRQGFDAGGEILLDADGPDGPEIFHGDSVDVGALAEQFFGLAIDPYPRSPDARLPREAGAEAPDSEFQSKLRSLLAKP